ncbi:MAG: S9 family peptidase, partial [Bacteroidia bacterium]|nr:S9 family peptidase [Bacteroidia bacterium]
MRKGIVYLLIFLTASTYAQDKMLTIQDAITGYHLYPRGLNQLQWLAEGNNYSQVLSNDSGQRYISVKEVVSNKDVATIELDDIKSSIADGNSISSLPYADWINAKELRFFANGFQYAYDFTTKKSRKLYETEVNAGITHSPKQNGFIRNTDKGIKGQIYNVPVLTETEEDGIVVGQAVHRFEFGIMNGIFWSPDGNNVAYYYMDESMVTEYPLYKLSDTPATATMLRYPTAGAQSHHVTVSVAKRNGDVINLKTQGPKDQFLTNISWTPDSRYILIAEVNREQNHMWLNQYDAVNGNFIKTLFEETNDKYVEPEHPAIFLENDPTKFVWWSERDGYNHLYLYDMDGKRHKQLTKGKWIVTKLHGFSSDGEVMFISGTKDSPLERHLYCVNTANGKIKKLTKEAGVHNLSANEDCSYFIDNFTSVTVPRSVSIMDAEGKIIQDLHTAENPLADYKLGEMDLGVLKSKGGVDLHYRVFKPVDFDSKKKYPVVVYLYNGPHLQLIRNQWLGGANLWFQYMAQQGYVVFSIDGRGSADRGFDFESAIFRNCGAKEMEDQLTGVDWLKKQPWVDGDRIGVHGWSYGGFMTTSLMTRNPGVYKVGVAGGPVIDWSLYEVMYT